MRKPHKLKNAINSSPLWLCLQTSWRARTLRHSHQAGRWGVGTPSPAESALHYWQGVSGGLQRSGCWDGGRPLYDQPSSSHSAGEERWHENIHCITFHIGWHSHSHSHEKWVWYSNMAWAETTLQSSLTRNFTLFTYSTPTCALPFTPPTLPLPPTHHKQRLSDYSLNACIRRLTTPETSSSWWSTSCTRIRW